jgi:hypothetical protein
MALVVKDRVQETSTTTGTGSLTLLGAVTGFQTFSSAIGNTNTTYYTIQNGAEWEVGVGTVSAGALSRDTVLESSNSGSLVNFSAGTKFVFCTYPAERSVSTDAIGVTVQAYDADTTKNDVANTFTANQTLQNNLIFSGTANRITGDFSNATQANRVAFQSSTTNGNTVIASIPNGTATTSAWNAFNNSDITNASLAQVVCTSSEASLRSQITGTGTYLPLTFQTNNSETMRIDTSGNVGIGTSSPDAELTVIGSGRFKSNSDYFPQINLFGASSTSGAAPYFIFSRGKGTYTSPTTISNGDSIGTVLFQGWDGTSYSNGASIYATSDNTVVTGNIKAALVFNSGYNVEAGRFDSSGNFRFNSGYGSAATAYGCRAWVKFTTPSGVPTVVGSGNVSSLTDGGTGITTVNFTNAMPDSNYAVSGFTQIGGTTVYTKSFAAATNDTWSSSAVLVRTASGTSQWSDGITSVAIFR